MFCKSIILIKLTSEATREPLDVPLIYTFPASGHLYLDSHWNNTTAINSALEMVSETPGQTAPACKWLKKMNTTANAPSSLFSSPLWTPGVTPKKAILGGQRALQKLEVQN